jgi:hypothetical protein
MARVALGPASGGDPGRELALDGAGLGSVFNFDGGDPGFELAFDEAGLGGVSPSSFALHLSEAPSLLNFDGGDPGFELALD